MRSLLFVLVMAACTSPPASPPASSSGDDSSADDSLTDDSAPALSQPETVVPEMDSRSIGEPVLQFDGEAPHNTPRNVLMISIDTLRRDSLSYYAGEDRDTPTFDRLLTDGVSFDKHRSCSNWTYVSVLCALTGQYAIDLDFFPESGGADPERYLPEGIKMVSTRLSEVGYSTALASGNHYLGKDYGFQDHYDELFHSGDGELILETGLGYVADRVDGDAPWMVHLHFLEPHTPYTPPHDYVDGAARELGYNLRSNNDVTQSDIDFVQMSPEDQALMRAYALRMYRGEIRVMDDLLEELMSELESMGALEDTLVVLWSDHGEQLWDRQSLTHGKELHDEETAAVVLFWAKDLTPASVVSPTTHRDIAPTLLHALGYPMSGPALGRVLGSETPDEPLFAGRLRNTKTVQSVDLGSERLIYSWDGTLQFYRLDEDPGELVNQFDAKDPSQYALWELLLPEVERLAEYYDDPAEPEIPEW